MKNAVITVLLLGALCLPAVAGTAVAGETIGVVRTASGDATVTRGETLLPADPGLKIMVGDTLRFTGHTTDLTMRLDSMEVNNERVAKALAGDYIGIKVPDRVRPSDEVFKVTAD